MKNSSFLKYLVPVLILQAATFLIGCNACNDRKTLSAYLPLLMTADMAWPMWQHDARHTGRSPHTGPRNPTAPAAADLCCFGIFGSPVVGRNSRVFLGSIRSYDYAGTCEVFEHPEYGASGLLHGLESGGAEISGFPFDSQRGSAMASAIECAPLLMGDGSVVFGKDDGWMYRLDSGGALAWESPADDTFNPLTPHDDNEQMIPSPLPAPGGMVVFLSHFADVYGPGAVADAVKLLCPAVDAFKATATRWYSKLYSLDARSGVRRWMFNPATDPASGYENMVGWGSPALGFDGSYIIGLMHTDLVSGSYVPTTGRVFAIAPDGSRRWVYPAAGESPMDYSLWTSPVVSPSGTIYMGASDYTYAGPAKIIALTSGGALRWEISVPENTIAASPALRSDGILVVATQNRHVTDPAWRYGRIYAVADRGDHAEIMWQYPAAGTITGGFFSSPLTDSAGRVYCANEPFPFVAGQPGTLLGLNPDGSLLFERVLDSYVHGNLALGADGALYVPLRKPPRLLVYRDL